MATLSEAMSRLAQHGDLQDAFCSRDVTLWVGAGLSRRALGGLRDIVERVVEWLQEKAVAAGWPARSRYADALDAIRSLTLGLIPPDRDLVRTPLTQWSDTPEALRGVLEGCYSQMLAAVQNRITEQLRTDVLDIPGTYAGTDVAPTAEHRLIALLTAEGLIGRVISTNWDDLIERACEAAGGPALGVIAGPQDVAGNQDPPFLAKIHGCARKAGEDVAYVSSLVLTSVDIAKWGTPENQGVRTLVDGAIRNGRCCFIGLSARDFNIQQAHFDAAMLVNPLPVNRLPTFATVQMNPAGQEAVLAAMDPAAAESGELAALVERATLGILANDVLGAVYVFAMFAKLEVIAERTPAPEVDTYREFVRGELTRARDSLVAWLDGLEDDERWDRVAFEIAQRMARALALYREGIPPLTGLTYQPLTTMSVEATRTEPNVPPAGLSRLMWAFLSVMRVARDHGLDLRFPLDPRRGQLLVGPESIATRVFVTHSSAGGAATLYGQGLLEGATPVVVINATSAAPPQRRVDTPERVFPGVERLSQVYLEGLASDPDGTMRLATQLLAEMPIGG